MRMDDERLLGLLYDLATAFGRMHGRLLGELSMLDAISGNSADNLLRKEEELIDALRREDGADPLQIELLTALLRAATEPVQQTFDVLNRGPRPPSEP
jgi:hypothetical protein